MLKQPIGIVNYTNVAIVRLKIAKDKFEIACYKNKVQQFRQKVEKEISEVLQIDKIYKNVNKGELAKKEDLAHYFPNMSYEDIVKLILDKGEIQVSEKERNLNFMNIKNDIANIIVEKTYNKENGLPFPQNVIIKVLEDIKFQIRDDQDAKKQALKAIKLIQEKDILPIERNLMNIFIRLKNTNIDDNMFREFLKKFLNFINENNSIINEINTDSPKLFRLKCNILPNHYRDLLTKYQELLSVEIISNSVKVESKVINKNYKYLEENEEEVKTTGDSSFNMKISNQMIDNMFNEEKKKKITCTKCKDTSYDNNDELRKHYKSNWHNFNVKLSAQNKPPLSAEEYDDFCLMNP